MARIRMLKPGIFTNERMAEFGPWHRLLFIGLWGLCDREGRLEDRPRRIRASVFPYDDGLDVSAMLQDLAGGNDPFLVRYQVEGQSYIWLPKFLKHQRPHKSEPDSVIPPFSGATDKSVLTTEVSILKERKGKETEMEVEKSGSAALSATPDEALLTFPTVGQGGSEWQFTQTRLAELTALYPSVDVLAEARKSLAWLTANPGRRKTPSGMPRFLVNWLNRANDHGGAMTARRLTNRAPEPRYDNDWFEECKRLHGSQCDGQFAHGLMMRKAQ